MSDNSRLDVVARIRRLRERSAQRQLADAQLRYHRAHERIQELRRPTYQGDDDRLDVVRLMALRAQGVRSAEEFALVNEELKKTNAEVAEAMEGVRRATSKRKAVENLAERRRLATAAVAARAAQASLDELVMMRRAMKDRSLADD
ncbi:MAG: hypothetical protein GY708_10770 [Actinomycetia bacterium]|nr:hypothetical protein [Actinomycetes bacterium]MCP4960840.1 hypothetical protein [Actinomycetes bacterium]